MKHVIIFSLVALLGMSVAFADDEPEAPATDQATEATEASSDQTAPMEVLKAVVVSVEGTVVYGDGRAPEEDIEWHDLEAGMELDEFTVIVTGFESKVVLDFPSQGVLTIETPTTFGISAFRRQGNEYLTQVGLKYGAMEMKVDPDRPSGEFSVATPAPKGSFGFFGFSDLGAAFDASTGFFLWLTQNGPSTLQGGQSGNGNNDLAAAIDNLRNDPIFGSFFDNLTNAEIIYLAQQPAVGGFFSGVGMYGANLDFSFLFAPIYQILNSPNGHVNGFSTDQ